MTWLEMVHEVAFEHGVSVTDDEADYLLWNETGFPEFFRGEPINACARQLREAFQRRGFRRLRPLRWFRATARTGGHPQPSPRCWPACSTCSTAWVLRRCYVVPSGMQWVWQRDCKHKV